MQSRIKTLSNELNTHYSLMLKWIPYLFVYNMHTRFGLHFENKNRSTKQREVAEMTLSLKSIALQFGDFQRNSL